MPEPVSALAGHLRRGRFGAGADEPSLVFAERSIGTLIQIGGWPDSFQDAVGRVLQRLGFAGVGGYGRAETGAAGVAFRTGPERVLLHLSCSKEWQAVAKEIDAALTPTLDLSHGRTLLAIAGANAPGLLARLLPLDFDDAVFPPDGFAQSGIRSVPVLVHRRATVDGQWFDLYLPRSYAVSIWELVGEVAAPFGYRVDAPE